MTKSPEAFRTISEVAQWLDVPTHVLRFWESRFTQVKPVKRAGGRRYYRPADMALLGGIKVLLHDDGLTIRGVQKILREQGIKAVQRMSPALETFLGDEFSQEAVDDVIEGEYSALEDNAGDAPAAELPESHDRAPHAEDSPQPVVADPPRAAEPDVVAAPEAPADPVEPEPDPVTPDNVVSMAPQGLFGSTRKPEDAAERADPPPPEDRAPPLPFEAPPAPAGAAPPPVEAPPAIPATPDVPEQDPADDAPGYDGAPGLAARLMGQGRTPAARPAMRNELGPLAERLRALIDRSGG